MLKINLKFKLSDIKWKGEGRIKEGHSIASAPCIHVLEAECTVLIVENETNVSMARSSVPRE